MGGNKNFFLRQNAGQNKIASFTKLALWKIVKVLLLMISKTQSSDILPNSESAFLYFPDFDINTVSWVADSFKCDIASI